MAAKKKAKTKVPRNTKKERVSSKDDRAQYQREIWVDAKSVDEVVVSALTAPKTKEKGYSNMSKLALAMLRSAERGDRDYAFAINLCKNVYRLGHNVLSDLKDRGVWGFAE